MISAAGWHAWRPAHLHVKVSAPGHELLTAQLYFPGDPHNGDDIASAVKPELMLDPQVQPDGTEKITYNFVLDPEKELRELSMLFHVRMDVHLPADLDPQQRAELVAPGEGLLAGTAAVRQVAAHLAHRGGVRQLLRVRRRIQ